jgi:hypothetical protein
MRSHGLTLCLALFAALCAHASASTLRANQVLVVYDSRDADSLAVAEFYAGSALVPGGTGGEAGVHDGLRVFDIASSGIASSAVNGGVFYDAFEAQVRDPIRAHLESSDLVYTIRCLALCKGLPHRVDDAASPGIGDQPGDFGSQLIAGGARSVSVDSELTLLWQDIPDINVDAFSTLDSGYIRNPYWRKSRPINTYKNIYIRSDKDWEFQQYRILARTSDDAPETTLTAGDMLLVCRLDGNSVADVRAMVNRAQGLVYDVDTAGVVLDESGSNGIADLDQSNSELDNVIDLLTREDDYETARDLLLADGRFDPANIHYNGASGVTQFQLGPNVDFNGEGIVITTPLILMTHYGRNHSGRPSINIAQYEESFNYAPGAVFSTMESYNGRAFNGLPTRYSQGQVADFVTAGGTFGIGMVWEPFAQTVPDTNWIVRNFILGGLTWAEAAYTAIPAVSWMHVVIGDPLARASRTSDDINGDGVVDIDDLYAIVRTPVDINRDGQADAADTALIEAAIRVPDQRTYDAGR